MKILAIETSCDETAVSIVEAEGALENTRFGVLGNALLSQVGVHQRYGGVFPSLAKREHGKNLIPLLQKALSEAKMLREKKKSDVPPQVANILARERELLVEFQKFIPRIAAPDIDAVAVTAGPGLEPALWVGINFAKALSAHWQKPVIPINHMEGHVLSAMLRQNQGGYEFETVPLPLLALLVSGGHTQLVLMRDWLNYEIIGETRDDAVGEAFDKVARMLGLPYPGGPEISKLAESARAEGVAPDVKLPRPMIHDATNDFSFAGLKTAVLYYLKKLPEVTEDIKKKIALEFETAVTDVLVAKTKKALDVHGAKTLALGGGVSANKEIRRIFAETFARDYPHVRLLIPARELTGDNAIMIAAAAHVRLLLHAPAPKATEVVARGNLSL